MNHCWVRASKIASLTLVFLFLAAASMAAGPRWRQATPFGGWMRVLAQSPSAPQTVYACAFFDQIFASADGGATWSRRKSLLAGSEIAEMFVEIGDPRTVYARTQSNLLFRTQDGSLSWSPMSALGTIFALAPDPEIPRRLYAATPEGLYRSSDGGDTWSLAGFDGVIVYSVAVDPEDNKILLAVTVPPPGSGIPIFWQSSDGGESWVETPPLPADPSQFFALNQPRFAFDPARAGTVYLFFPSLGENTAPVFRSTDSGKSWAPLPAAAGARDLLALPNGLLLAASNVGVARSSDAGETWSPPLPTIQGAPRDAIARIYADAAAPGAVFALGTIGVWRSADSGTTWVESNQGLQALPVLSIAAAPSGPDTVIAVAGNGVFSSTDHGDRWTRVHSDFSGLQPWTIEAFDPRDPQTMYGIGSDGQAAYLLRSTDGGQGWTELPIPYACSGGSLCSVEIWGFALDPGNPDTLYLSGSYFIHFQGTGEFVLRSDDGGQTWKDVTIVHNVRKLAIAPGRKGALFGTTCKGLYRSDTRGASWRKVGAGLPGSLCNNGASGSLAIDPRNPQRIYVGTAGQGVFVSTDGGSTFRAMNKGLQGVRIATLLIDPTDPAKLYAAVPGRGVFRWKAGLRTWVPLNAGLPVATFDGVLALDPQDPSILYAGTSDQGIFRLDLNE